MSNTIDFRDQKWVVERHKDYCLSGFRFEKVLFSQQSQFQKVEVIETSHYGRLLLNDDLVMVSEKDEFVYHEMMAHVPLMVHPLPKKVLIIGGGDGGTAREVLRHDLVEKCVLVEIDEMVVKACRQYIPQTASVFDHPKLQLQIGDGVEFVRECSERFDVILVDSTDPIGPAQPLFGADFYSDIYKLLNEDGVVVSQGESCWYDPDMQKKLLTILNQKFSKVGIYNFNNLTYPGGLWSFTFASKKYDPILDFNAGRAEKSGLEFRYYNSSIHRGAFCLPQFMSDNLRGLINLGSKS